MMTFNDYCNLHQCDKGDGYDYSNHYANFYENWFSPIREKSINICEIGIFDGASLRCYYDYFPNAKILGLDINGDKTHHRNDRVHTDVLDQSNKEELIHFANKHIGEFDFLLDDGIIEDLGSSFFALDMIHSYYKNTLVKINNNTVKFLTERPFSSVWINNDDLEYINENVEYVSIFDKVNKLPYSKNINCLHNYPIRSITAIIKKK